MTNSPMFDTMSTMRAMRRLKPDPVPEELLTQLIRAATWAPSGSNIQGYQYVVVTDRAKMAEIAKLWNVIADFYMQMTGDSVPPNSTAEKMRKLRAALRYQQEHFHETPALIVFCYDSGPLYDAARANLREIISATKCLGGRRILDTMRHVRRTGEMSEAASVYPGVENLLLAPRELGLGATLTTWHLMFESEFKKILGIPRRVKTFAVIPVGWPVGRFGPVSRVEPDDVIHRDGW